MKQSFWQTGISLVKPNEIRICGYDIADLITNSSFGDIIYLLFTGHWPQAGEGRLVEAILVACCDHGLIAPSTDATRLVASSGVPLPSSVAAGILAIGDYHGGAVEKCAKKFLDGLPVNETNLADAAEKMVSTTLSKGERLPGYGHPIHNDDPRVRPLFDLAEKLGFVTKWIPFSLEIERCLKVHKGYTIPINIDGAIAAILLEIDIDWRLGNALFLISRTAGLSAHHIEQISKEPPFKAANYEEITYTGPKSKNLPIESR